MSLHCHRPRYRRQLRNDTFKVRQQNLPHPNIGRHNRRYAIRNVNTPTHVILSVATLTRPSDGDSSGPTFVVPAVLGAFVPDAAMFVFYAVEKFLFGNSERDIWTTRYYLPPWQDFFDLFNSIPVVAVAMLIAWRFRKTGWLVFFASMLLHIVCDFPLHHDDGHRHFWPLSGWRFQSPVSYWDPNHFGIYAGMGELALFIGCCIAALRIHRRFSIRVAIMLLAILHLGFMVFALIYWANAMG